MDTHAKIDEQGVQMRVLHEQAVAKIDEQGAQMHRLHEDVIVRIALLSEGLGERGPKVAHGSGEDQQIRGQLRSGRWLSSVLKAE